MVLGAAPLANGAPCASATGTPKVYDYPIVLKGPPAMIGARVDAIAAYAMRGGTFHEVPVQVEEVNSHGDYVLKDGLPFTKATDDGRFDDNDEIALDGKDLGEPFAFEAVPEAQKKDAWKLWRVAFCRGDGAVGQLLLVARSHARPSPFFAGVTFDKARGEVDSPFYRYKFHERHPALLGEVALKRNGALLPVLKNSSFRMPLKTPFFMPDMTFEENDFSSSIESWQTGPVRSIVAVGVKYTAFLSLFKLHLFSELVFYRNRFVIPTVIEFVFDPSSVLKPGSGIAYALNFPDGKTWAITANLEPLPSTSPADVIASGKTAARTDVFKVEGHSADGSFLVDVRVDPKARAMVPPPFLVRREQFQSAAHAANWPWLKELQGDIGVYLDFSRVHKGLYDFGLDLLLSPKADETFIDYGIVESSWQAAPAGKAASPSP